jgi:hypothetical protein
MHGGVENAFIAVFAPRRRLGAAALQGLGVSFTTIVEPPFASLTSTRSAPAVPLNSLHFGVSKSPFVEYQLSVVR